MDRTLVEQLIEKSMESLRRDLGHIFSNVSRGKLDASAARDLVAYIKVLKELEVLPDDEMEKLKKMNKEELENEAKRLIENAEKKK
jgi:hypothetical protein